jgi:monoamine oxidase
MLPEVGRTPVFSALERAMRLAWAAARTGRSVDDLAERAQARRGVSRRGVLTGALAAGGALAVGCGPRAARSGPAAAPRIGIVGGGIGGLSCAWHLQQAGLAAEVLEGSARVGGRMFSARGKFGDGQVAELGGELINTDHKTMHALAAALDIELDDLHHGEPPGHARETFFVGGRHVTEAELAEAFRPLAARMATAMAAADADPAQLAALDELSITAWLDREQAGAMLRGLLTEAYTGEFGLEADEQSALNLLTMIDYEDPEHFHLLGDSDERFHTRGGNDLYTTRLAERLGGAVAVGTRLVAITELPGGGYRLALDRDGAAVERTFDHVVLAIPFTLLREVDVRVELPPAKRQVIAELAYGTNAKLMGGFSSRPWREIHNASGTAVTDAELQFIWDTARGQPGAAGLLTNYCGGRRGAELGRGTADEQLRAALPTIDRIFPGTAAAYTGTAVRMHWPTVKLVRGSFACYRVGQLGLHGLAGERVGNLHFCGEHCAGDTQGFMEGAAETGAAVAAAIAAELSGAAAPAAPVSRRHLLGARRRAA